jgi:mannose-6-phosphate isomerase-like protein (cupin superfamily)
MPKTSKATAPHHEDMGVMEGHYAELDRYTVGFETFREDADATPLFRGLPDDRCQSPHWGYVVRGKVIFHFADRSEIYETGDAYYAPPGHIPVVSAGTELVEFSDTTEFGRTVEAIGRNMAEMQMA